MVDTATRLSMLQERFKSGTQKIYIESLRDALTIIEGNLSKLDSLTEIKRQVALKKLLEDEIGSLYGKLIEPLQEDMQGFAEIEYEGIHTALNEATQVGYAFAGLPKGTMQKIISMNEVRLIGDKAYTYKELFDNAKTSQINNYKQIIAGGLASNSGYKAITKRLKQANAKATTNLEAIVHTAISNAREEADKQAYKDFDDVITGWESVSVLDSRTSLLCAGLDGRKYYKKQGYPTYDKIPNRPPRHFRCRSKLVPITDFKTKTTRASNGDEKGQVDAKTNFDTWFSSQSEDFQENYLGKGRYELYKTGKLKIKDFVDIKTGERFTLDEIRAKFVGAKIKPQKAKPTQEVKETKKTAKNSKSEEIRPVIDLGFGKKFNDYLKEGTTRALRVIDKLPKPNKIITGKGWYRRSSKTISTPNKKVGTFFHEYGHYIDNHLGRLTNKDYLSHNMLVEASRKDAELLGLIDDGSTHPQFFREKRHKILSDLHSKWFKKKELYFTRGRRKGMKKGYVYEAEFDHHRGFSDIIDSMTVGEFYDKYYGAGHGSRYYRGRLESQMTENFANLFRAYASKEGWEEAKELFPNLTKEFENIMNEVLDGRRD